MANHLLVTSTSKKAQRVKFLDQVSCISYFVQFQKNKSKNVLACLDFKSKINAMTPAYTAYLGLKVEKTNVTAQKIDSSLLKT